MSSSTAAPADSATADRSPDEVVTLAILYAAKQPGRTDPAGFATVRIRVTRRVAADIVNFRHSSVCTTALFRDLDADGGPYSIDVGSAVAVYVEH
jgi:hypothetical protein